MIHPHFIHSVLNEPWAISPEFILANSVLISNLFDPKIEFERGSPTLPEIHSIEAASKKGSNTDANANQVKNIQVITITGPVMKQDQYCGPAGMKTIGQWIQQADKDNSVDGILLVLDTPGGTVAGTEELSTIIKGTQKPIVAFVEDLAASAGYWIGSSADELIANNTTAQVGSIGVLMSFDDIIPALEMIGVKRHTVTAPQSTEKTAMFDKLRKGDYEEYKKTVLAPLAEKFINTVKANRPDVKDEQLTGKVFFAKDLLGSMVDSIATFDQALQRVAQIAYEREIAGNNTSANFINPQIEMKQPELKRLAKAASVDAFESADGSIALTAEQAEAVETALEDAEIKLSAAIDASTQSGQAATDAKNESSLKQTRILQLEGELQTANDRIAELSKSAGAESAEVVTEISADTETTGTVGFLGRLNEMINIKNKL